MTYNVLSGTLKPIHSLTGQQPSQHSLFEVSPDLDQSLLQFSQVAHCLFVYVLLHATPDSVINGI